MSIFDDLAGKLQEKYGPGAEGNKTAAQALRLIEGMDNGLEGLVAKFEQAGLKEQAQSWVAKGKNLPVTAAQVKAALGPELEKFAQKADMTVDAAAAKIAEVMPVIVDKLTPDGVAPKVAELKYNLGRLADKLTGKKPPEETPPE
jgi:uncharacterized protein YidB (DUF937 family)